MGEEPQFEIGRVGDLKRKFGLTAENRPKILLDPTRVPEQFRGLIPLAERWGIGDDLVREDCVMKATEAELTELLSIGSVYDAMLTEWLVGPESYSPNPTDEYVAFSCLGMAWDLADFVKRQRKKDTSQ
jgi:hypothetical protein